MSLDCTYCGCDVTAHDPVTVVEGADTDGERVGRFCNYGCLAAYVDAADLTVGTSCSVDIG